MKKKYILISLLSVATVVATAVGLTACGETHEHTMQSISAKEATCTEAGNKAYFKCSGCEKYFSDEAGNTEITEASTVIAAKGHSMTKHDAVAATCTEAGAVEHYTCANEDATIYYKDEAGSEKLETVSVAAKGHTMTEHEAIAATCTEDGNVKYYTCANEEDTVYYADEAGTEPLETVVVAARGHRIRPIAEKAATCSEAGVSAHYECAACNTLFSDEEGTTEIEDADSLTIPATGEHDFGFLYTVDTMPAPDENGGALGRVCSVCGLAGEAGEALYRKGFIFEKSNTKQTELDEVGLYYGQLDASQRMDAYIGFQATKAGTYTLKFTDVAVDEGVSRRLYGVWIDTTKYGTTPTATKMVIYNGDWSTSSGMLSKVEQWKTKILLNGESYQSGVVAVTSISFTVSGSDLEEGTLYIKIRMQDGDFSDPASTKSPDHAGGYLIDFAFEEIGAKVTDVQQAALLPSKHED